MQKSITGILIFFAALLMLSSCNMPLEKKVEKATPANQFVNVEKTTELRSGPGEVYDLVGVLNPNQAVEVIGRSADGKYLMIHNPANQQVFVWLKNGAGMFAGDPINLPVATAPPTPTPVITLTCFMCGTDPNVLTPVPTPTPVITSVTGSGCPTPIGGGPTLVSCSPDGAPATGSGCPTPIGGGPTLVSCSPGVLRRLAVAAPHRLVAARLWLAVLRAVPRLRQRMSHSHWRRPYPG